MLPANRLKEYQSSSVQIRVTHCKCVMSDSRYKCPTCDALYELVRVDSPPKKVSGITVEPRRQKYSASLPRQITGSLRASCPAGGAYRDRHGRWDGMRWTRRRTTD